MGKGGGRALNRAVASLVGVEGWDTLLGLGLGSGMESRSTTGECDWEAVLGSLSWLKKKKKVTLRDSGR